MDTTILYYLCIPSLDARHICTFSIITVFKKQKEASLVLVWLSAKIMPLLNLHSPVVQPPNRKLNGPDLTSVSNASKLLRLYGVAVPIVPG